MDLSKGAERQPDAPDRIINPLAVIALVAALLGIIPVAIVFGVLALRHRGGRGMAISALVLGALELVAVLGFFAVLVGGSNDTESATALPRIEITTTTSTSVAPTIESTVVPPPPPAPTTVEPPVVTTTKPPATVAQGATCTRAQVRSFGTASDGSTLVCASMGSANPPRWVAMAGTIAPGVHNAGTACDPDTQAVGRDFSGLAVMCSLGTWQSGP
ncbi:DUF4190 domain-containing protein [Nocardia yamanashiensis]|uniref:DUF4190 domain-containing protein n=1 Tax=Nocardia yamanashiensis TaxID=209247 RepID=UPI000ADD438B|nr:DUF4190 domain-containing protein [Nocardia yamanashiensis]